MTRLIQDHNPGWSPRGSQFIIARWPTAELVRARARPAKSSTGMKRGWCRCLGLFQNAMDRLDDCFRCLVRNVVPAVSHHYLPPSGRQMRESFLQLKLPRVIMVQLWILFLILNTGGKYHKRQVAIATAGTR